MHTVENLNSLHSGYVLKRHTRKTKDSIIEIKKPKECMICGEEIKEGKCVKTTWSSSNCDFTCMKCYIKYDERF